MAFLTQFNPLVGPQIDFDVAAHMRRVWSISAPPPNAPEECEWHFVAHTGHTQGNLALIPTFFTGFPAY